MFLNYLRAALLVISLSSVSSQAALITSLNNLNIGGTLYNAQFNVGFSFNELFDADANKIFGDDSSMFNRAPTFWGDQTSAILASNAIITALSQNDYTVVTPSNNLSDSFIIPWGFHATPALYVAITDGSTSLVNDLSDGRFPRRNETLPSRPLVTFKLASSSIPTPPTLALTGLALGIMVFMGRRRRVC